MNIKNLKKICNICKSISVSSVNMNTKEYNKAVDSFADKIYRFIKSNTGDAHTAEDVVQDSFEKLWIHRKNVEFEKAKSFLFTTAYNRMIDIIRKEKRIVRVESINDDLNKYSPEFTGVNEILHKAVMRLNETQRMVVLLRDYEGYSYQEIAEITNLSETQVKVYIFRARKFLKEIIGKKENVL